MIIVFNDLEHVADYSQRPMPKIALQAVQFVFWVSLVIGTLDNHHTNFDKKSGFRELYHPALLLILVSYYFYFTRKLVTEYACYFLFQLRIHPRCPALVIMVTKAL